MTDKTMPDEIWVDETPTDKEPYCYYYQATDHEPTGWLKQTQYHHHRIVEAQQAEIERLREGLEKIVTAPHTHTARTIAHETLQTQKESE